MKSLSLDSYFLIVTSTWPKPIICEECLPNFWAFQPWNSSDAWSLMKTTTIYCYLLTLRTIWAQQHENKIVFGILLLHLFTNRWKAQDMYHYCHFIVHIIMIGALFSLLHIKSHDLLKHEGNVLTKMCFLKLTWLCGIIVGFQKTFYTALQEWK